MPEIASYNTLIHVLINQTSSVNTELRGTERMVLQDEVSGKEMSHEDF